MALASFCPSPVHIDPDSDGEGPRPTILLGSGGYFDYEDPGASPITIEDIAYGLAYACRFAGQCWSSRLGRRVFYSVAEHCVRMSYAVPSHAALHALLHEVGEAPCGDMTAPLKSICPDFKRVEKRAEAALLARFGVTASDPALIKLYDLRMLATERRDLMRWNGEPWSILDGIEPLEDVIVPWAPDAAAQRFLERHRELAPPR